MKIKRFKQYNEAISGTEMIGSMGPNYGQPVSPRTLSNNDVTVLHSQVTDEMYTEEDFNGLYTQYLAKGGEPLNGFNKSNLDKILQYLAK